MLKKLFGKQVHEETVLAPLNGETVCLDDVPDPTFSKRMMGEGIAIMPSDGKVVSPVKGKVAQVFPTKHAVGITTEAGLEILVHIGLETVSLNGEGFESHVEAGDKVNSGDPLITFDIDFVKANAESLVTPVIVTEGASTDELSITSKNEHVSAGESTLLTYKKNN